MLMITGKTIVCTLASVLVIPSLNQVEHIFGGVDRSPKNHLTCTVDQHVLAPIIRDKYSTMFGYRHRGMEGRRSERTYLAG